MGSNKPASLLYGLDDKPPIWITLLQGLQHVGNYAASLVFPVLIVRAIGGTTEQASFIVSMSMLAGGIGVIMQAFRKGPVGSGYLCPQVCGPSFLSASILAAKTGGLSLLFGMTFVAGVFEALFSRVIKRLRFVFPAEVTGFIVAMVGITVIRFASLNFLGLGTEDTVTAPSELFVSFLTLAVMVGLNVWSKGKLKMFCVLIGMAVGYLAAYILGLLSESQIQTVSDSPFLWFPAERHPGWSFSLFLVIPFFVAMVCSTLKSVGDLTLCQKINDADWKRPDMTNIGKGILADSIGCMAGGVFGGMGQSTSSSNIGLSIATGTTSRIIAYAMGPLLIALAFFPKLCGLFAIMPKPVLGATLIFAVSFMIVAGIQIIVSRMIDARKTFVVGISLIFGLSVDIIPEVFADIHPWLRPIFSSSLSLAAITALTLNLIFRIGIAKKVKLTILPAIKSLDEVFEFMEKNGGAWGARRDVISKATGATNEFLEAMIEHNLTRDPIDIYVTFDEFNLDVDVRYRGELIEFPMQSPDMIRVLEEKTEQLRFSGFMIRRYADKIAGDTRNGVSNVRLHFDH
jgi:NCS2 family nucleobase:cation symporter-2